MFHILPCTKTLLMTPSARRRPRSGVGGARVAERGRARRPDRVGARGGRRGRTRGRRDLAHAQLFAREQEEARARRTVPARHRPGEGRRHERRPAARRARVLSQRALAEELALRRAHRRRERGRGVAGPDVPVRPRSEDPGRLPRRTDRPRRGRAGGAAPRAQRRRRDLGGDRGAAPLLGPRGGRRRRLARGRRAHRDS